jgi:hypothetical protein
MAKLQHGIPYPAPPAPEPAHQRRITRQKWFEITVVVLLVCGGVGFLAWRSGGRMPAQSAGTLHESGEDLLGLGARENAAEAIFGLEFRHFSQELKGFECRIAIAGAAADTPLDLAVISLWPEAGEAPPDAARQAAVNHVLDIGLAIVPASGEALEKAVRTSELVSEVPRPHDKGVAATNNGWKATYITYRSFDDSAAPEPVLYYILQRLTAASEDTAAPLYRTLFEAVHNGQDVMLQLREAAR